VALVGRSGSGKSTLGYMFNLLYAPTHGKIRFDGVEHTQLPLPRIRRSAAMIVQDNSIFSGTILENIALGDPHPSFERVVEAAQAADAHEFISGFPKGYSTQLGESGEGLSGGQKQRINIARALYRDPRILIMDEATSSLDALSEAKIVKNLKSRKGTTIVIAHRLNTVMHADRIVVLDRGRIVEQGSHKELLARRGHYSRLFAKQLAL
jgi:ABC-type multidrug transport system fused ATPase/permease subunit